MLLNMFPTPEPKSAMITITAIPTSKIIMAYSTRPWPRGEKMIIKTPQALNEIHK